MREDFTIYGTYLTGYFRKDAFGRIVVDQCPSDEEHLRSGITYAGDDRAKCRVLLEDLFEKVVGKTGRLYIERAEFESIPMGQFGPKTLIEE